MSLNTPRWHFWSQLTPIPDPLSTELISIKDFSSNHMQIIATLVSEPFSFHPLRLECLSPICKILASMTFEPDPCAGDSVTSASHLAVPSLGSTCSSRANPCEERAPAARRSSDVPEATRGQPQGARTQAAAARPRAPPSPAPDVVDLLPCSKRLTPDG